VVTPKAVKTVNECPTHRCKEDYQHITTAKPQPAINAGCGLSHLSDDSSGSNGASE
jgi:hypothetical protein